MKIKKRIFVHVANLLHSRERNLFSNFDLINVLMDDKGFLPFMKKLVQDTEFVQNPQNKKVFLEDKNAFLSSVVQRNLTAEEWGCEQFYKN